MRKAVVAFLFILFIFLGAVAVDLYLSKDNVTVSGKAIVVGEIAAIIQTIEFTDTQTGTTITSHFTFAPQTQNAGNYSVVLKNEHTYNVYISHSIFTPKSPKTNFITTFTVNASDGQKAITKNFAYPNIPNLP